MRITSLVFMLTVALGLGAAPSQGTAASGSIRDFIIAHYPEYLKVQITEEGIEEYWGRNGWADVDLDGSGSKDYRVVFYTDGGSGAVLVFWRQGDDYHVVWETGPNRNIGTGFGTGVSLIDIEGDERPELHLSTSTHRYEAHYLFRWNRENRELVSLLEGERPYWPYGAFGGSSVFFADFDNDGRLDVKVNEPFYAEDQPMYKGPSGTRQTLWRFDGQKFSVVGTRTVRDQDHPDAVEPPFSTIYTDVQVRPKEWRQSWLTGQGPGASVEGQEHRHVVFYLRGIENDLYRLDEVDRTSFRVVAPQGSLLRPVRPRSALLKAAEAEAAEGNQGVGGPRIEVTFLVADLLEMARAPQPVPGPAGKVCFDLQSNLTGRPGLVRAWACLPVSDQ